MYSSELVSLIRTRAYGFFEQEGCRHGHHLDHWLRAEKEVLGVELLHEAGADDPEMRIDLEFREEAERAMALAAE